MDMVICLFTYSLVSRRGKNSINNQTLGLTDLNNFFFFVNTQYSDSNLSVFFFFPVCEFLVPSLFVVNNLNFAGLLFTLFFSALHYLKKHGSFT